MSKLNDQVPYLDTALSPLIEQHQRDKEIPVVAISVVTNDGILWRYEKAVTQQGVHVVPDNTLYRIGSITKLFTQILAMQLVESDRLNLATPIDELLPNCSPSNPFATDVCLEHLLTHTSGIQRELPGSSYFGLQYKSLAESIQGLRQTHLQFEPGSKTRYSNAATGLLGWITGELQDRSWDELVRTKIFQPLRLNHAYTGLTSDLEIAPAVCTDIDGTPSPAPRLATGQSPSGSLVMTLDDLARFAQGLVNRGLGSVDRFIGRETLETMWQPSLSSEHGLGFFVREVGDHPSFGHGGTIYGFSSELEVVPTKDIGVVVCATRDIANGFARRLATTVLEIVLATNRPMQISAFSPSTRPRSTEAIEGTFHNKDHNQYAAVYPKAGKLRIECLGYIGELRRIESRWVIDSALLFLDDVQYEDDELTINGVEFSRLDRTVQPEETRYFGLDGFPCASVYQRHGRLWLRLFDTLFQPLIPRGEGFTLPDDSPIFAGEHIVLNEDAIELAGSRLVSMQLAQTTSR